jgi:hypothetical protein
MSFDCIVTNQDFFLTRRRIVSTKSKSFQTTRRKGNKTNCIIKL